LGTAEGCHILKKDGWYYFFTAEGGTESGHRECVYRSKRPTGPFEAPPDGVNPLIYNADHPDIQNTGHMDLIEGDGGKWVAVFLGVRPVFAAGAHGMPSQLGRETFMAPMEWVDGWPVVNSRKQIELVGEAEGLTLLPETTNWIDEFKGKGELRQIAMRFPFQHMPTTFLLVTALDLGWYNVRVPLHSFCYSTTERPGYLAIRGSPVTIVEEHSPSMLLQKQTSFNVDWETQVEFAPTKPGQEAGTAVWISKSAHASVGVRGVTGGKVEMVFRTPNPEGKLEEKPFPVSIAPGAPVTLLIKARKHEYTLAFQVPGEEHVVVGSVESKAFQPMFTGTHFGLYAQGANDTPCINSAYFKYAKWDIPTL
jgi:beta-xylosidase